MSPADLAAYFKDTYTPSQFAQALETIREQGI